MDKDDAAWLNTTPDGKIIVRIRRVTLLAHGYRPDGNDVRPAHPIWAALGDQDEIVLMGRFVTMPGPVVHVGANGTRLQEGLDMFLPNGIPGLLGLTDVEVL